MIKARSRLVLALCATISLTSCAFYSAREQLTALSQSVPSGSPFVQRLMVEYRDMASQDYDQYQDYEDAAHFSAKGLQAASGLAVLPENPDDWLLVGNAQAQGMLAGRETLIDLLDNGGRDLAPDFSAVAQARFDCWVERTGKIISDNDDAITCKAAFKQALDQARAAIEKPEPVATAMPQNNDELHAAKFIVFFDWNKASLTKAADKVIDTAISESKRLGANKIDVMGNADKSGTEQYNQKLSLARALAVKERLVARGIPADLIDTSAHGDDKPLVETARGVREPANRRVEIHFE